MWHTMDIIPFIPQKAFLWWALILFLYLDIFFSYVVQLELFERVESIRGIICSLSSHIFILFVDILNLWHTGFIILSVCFTVGNLVVEHPSKIC